MPIYEYKCPKCGKVFEEWTMHHDSPELKPCPACGENSHRIISNTSFLLKGRGWYATEYGVLKGKGDDETPSAKNEHTEKPSTQGSPEIEKPNAENTSNTTPDKNTTTTSSASDTTDSPSTSANKESAKNNAE